MKSYNTTLCQCEKENKNETSVKIKLLDILLSAFKSEKQATRRAFGKIHQQLNDRFHLTDDMVSTQRELVQEKIQ